MNARDNQVFEGLPVKSISIENLLRQRDAVLARVEQAGAVLNEAAELYHGMGFGDRGHRGEFTWALMGDGRYRCRDLTSAEGRAQVRKSVDAMGWQLLMNESGMRTLMDHTARAQWDEKIYNNQTPELTLDNIKATFGMMHDTRGEIFERGVIRIFNDLSWCYKTNLPQKFGKRIVMRLGSQWSSWNQREKLDDLQRVFSVMDGKPEEDHRASLYARYVDARRMPREPGAICSGEYTRGELDDEYVSIRWFKNGNAHVTFKRPDLVEAMNKIIAKHYPGALPAPK